MRKFILSMFLFCLIICNSYCYAEEIIFEGIPVDRGRGSVDNSYNEPLNEQDRLEYKVVIAKEGNDYIWRSRENKSLIHSKSGIYHCFTNPDGSGYIKITQVEDNKCLYMEHMTLGLETITYWGIGKEFKL